MLAREDVPGEKRLVAYYTVSSEPSWCRSGEPSRCAPTSKQLLPPYMIPVAYVGLASLPLTPNGKVDRKALPSPGRRCVQPPSSTRLRRGELEEALAQIWRELLQDRASRPSR